MDLWKKLNDTSEFEKVVPCVLCQKDSVQTVIGNHFKCSDCDHLFNQDGSPLPEDVKCTCKVCLPEEKEEKEEEPQE